MLFSKLLGSIIKYLEFNCVSKSFVVAKEVFGFINLSFRFMHLTSTGCKE
jgi:hypothetical protein